MKFILLAAAAMIVMPAAMSANAQTSGSTGTSSPMSNAGQTPAVQNGTPPADTTMPAPSPQGTMPTDSTTTPPAPMQQPMASDTMTTTQTAPMPAQTTGDPVGGYQPAAPAMSGQMTPGATVVFQPAPSPDQAYPAPAPLAKYPVCKKGEFDKCVQGPRSTHSSEVRGRSSR